MNKRQLIVAVAVALICAVGLSAYFVWANLPTPAPQATLASLPQQCRSSCGENEEPLTIDERIATSLVSWIVDDQKLPGFDESYVNQGFMKDRSRFIVVCDFVRDDLFLSNDERVYRIEPKDFDSVFDTLGYEGKHDYIKISISEREDGKIYVWLTNHYGYLAGHGYEFVFEVDGDSFTASGHCAMVS